MRIFRRREQREDETGGLGIEIGRMREIDVPSVYSIERQVFPTPWSIMGFLSGVSRPDTNIMLVAKLGGRVVGYGCLFYALDEGHITNIAVDPAFQRRGIGSRLLFSLIREATRRGIHSIFLEVRESNLIAQHLYRKFGFEYQGIRRGYYADTGENALVYWVDDITRVPYLERLRSFAEDPEKGEDAG